MKRDYNLFEDKSEEDHFNGVLWELGKRYNREELEIIFDRLPDHIQNIAYDWGLSDTVFRDEAYVYIKENTDILDNLEKKKSTNEYGVDVDYFSNELLKLERSLENRTPEELYRYLLALAEVAKPL